MLEKGFLPRRHRVRRETLRTHKRSLPLSGREVVSDIKNAAISRKSNSFSGRAVQYWEEIPRVRRRHVAHRVRNINRRTAAGHDDGTCRGLYIHQDKGVHSDSW